jgi:hypothetical protein
VRVRCPFALVLAAASACGTPVRPPAPPPAPGEVVIAHFDPPRELTLERGPADTVRVHAATQVIGRLRAVRGDTAWIVTSRVRSLHDDGRGAVPGWTTVVVSEGRTQVVPLSRDSYTDRQGSKELGTLIAFAAVAAGAAVLLLVPRD